MLTYEWTYIPTWLWINQFWSYQCIILKSLTRRTQYFYKLLLPYRCVSDRIAVECFCFKTVWSCYWCIYNHYFHFNNFRTYSWWTTQLVPSLWSRIWTMKLTINTNSRSLPWTGDVQLESGNRYLCNSSCLAILDTFFLNICFICFSLEILHYFGNISQYWQSPGNIPHEKPILCQLYIGITYITKQLRRQI